MVLRTIMVASASLLAIGASGAAQAQASGGDGAPSDQPPGGTQSSQSVSEDEIVVTGIRGSLRQAIEAKRQSDVVSDVITAEDIGKFPDKNAAEALQRIPGIVINREFGEGERVSLRGTAPNLTRTLLNGHAVATADWFILEQLAATRSFNYLTLPVDVVGQIDVYKSPQADVEEGGIGGTINVHTRNPLDLAPFVLTGSLQGAYTEKSDSLDPQASALISWKNEAETIGLLFGAVYQKRDIRRDGVEVLGYFTPAGAPAGTAQVPSLIGSALFQQERERYGANTTLQFRPSDQLEINLTGLYSHFGANNFNQNYLAWGSNALGGGGTLTNATVEDGTVVKGRITSAPGGRAVVYDAIDREAFAENWSADFDTVYRPTETSKIHLKLGYTKASGDTESQPFYEGGAPGAFDFNLTGRVPQVTFIGVDPTDPSDLAFDFASLHKITNDDKEKYAYLDFEQEVGWGPVRALSAGLKYTDHDRVTRFDATTYGGFFLPLLASGCGGPCTSPFFAGKPTPSNFLNDLAEPGTLTNFFQIDRKKLRNTFFALPAEVRARIPNPPENYSINEKAYGGYVMATLGQDGGKWSGNIGVRVIRTDQTSRGNIVGAAGPGAISNAFGDFIPVVVERSYTDVLPSANVKFDLSDQFVLRLGAGETMARPDFTDIVPRVSLNPGTLTADAGDPFVDPFRATTADVSLEWYPDRDTIVALALYYKDIESYIVNSTTQGIFPVQTATPNLSRCTPVAGSTDNLYNCVFDVNRRSNGGGGTNKGFEIQASRPVWGGFGVQANYTYSDASSSGGDPIPGNSKHSLNLTGYYENDWLSARLAYNYRSSFFINIDRATPLNQGSTESLDASINIDVIDNVTLTFDAVNLTNDKIFQYAGTQTRFRAMYDNGRQFYFGVRLRY
ncbi:TonB-dependent receptor [Allosphingosinicella deserti]|uniref:TonB-dependent receptor n=1 Tax=Allosphingosinicella deserti TaxID=2116704 RepID=A0A2P7QZX4_9SPHN|nr:TonB-dependent receptor [Sphingomonas deserti]PSJ43520.1 TonB-dependent receptor [Sphingomonas deserti]